MGNCQAVDTASLVIQHPSGKSHVLFHPIQARDIMRSNPGHHVALLINTTTTTTLSTASSGGAERSTIRITRIKLLKPADTLTLGHAYRLITSQEVMKELVARKQAKMKQGDGIPDISKEKPLNKGAEARSRLVLAEAGKSSSKYEKKQGQILTLSSAPRSKAWQPSLKSISEQTPKAT